MKTFYLLTLICLAFVLTGCATATPVPTAAATIVIEATETLMPMPTATATPQRPTATAQPTEIPATPTPNPTQVEQAYIQTRVAPCNVSNPDFSYSPKKHWAIANCLSDNQDGITTKFARLENNWLTSVSFNDDYIKLYKADDARMSTLLQQSFIPVRWTMNEDFVYLAVPSPVDQTPYKGYDGLFRLDLSSGKMNPILRPATAPLSVSYTFQFSPYGNKLAHINQSVQSVAIVIADTATGENKTIKLDARFVQAGSLLWSEDETRLVVSAIDANTNGGNALIIYNLETNKNEYILQGSEVTYLPISWNDPDTIYAKTATGEDVYINIVTKSITQNIERKHCCGCSCNHTN